MLQKKSKHFEHKCFSYDVGEIEENGEEKGSNSIMCVLPPVVTGFHPKQQWEIT